MKLVLCNIICLCVLASCGGGGGGSANSGGGSNHTGGTDAPTTQVTIGTPFSFDGTEYTATKNGYDFVAAVYYTRDEQPMLYHSPLGNERIYNMAFSGTYVSGFGASYTMLDNPANSFSFFGFSGAQVSQLPSGTFVYSGIYQRVDATRASENFDVLDIELETNFDSGQVSGTFLDRANSGENVVISGQITGSGANLTINDDWGQHQLEGSFYGPQAQEFAGGYTEGAISGMIYAAR